MLDEKFLPTLVSMAAFLVQRLNHDNPEVRLEAVKAIGNLSRSTWVLDDLAQGPAYSKLIALLLAGDSVLQERVLGIFINASSHAASKELFFGGNREVLKAFLCVLRKCAIKHIIVSTQVCKVKLNRIHKIWWKIDSQVNNVLLGTLQYDIRVESSRKSIRE